MAHKTKKLGFCSDRTSMKNLRLMPCGIVHVHDAHHKFTSLQLFQFSDSSVVFHSSPYFK